MSQKARKVTEPPQNNSATDVLRAGCFQAMMPNDFSLLLGKTSQWKTQSRDSDVQDSS